MRSEKYFLSYLLVLILSKGIIVNAQNPVENLSCYRFCIIEGTDSIEYIMVGTDLEKPRPTVIFCQGSQPVPLIIQTSDGSKFFSGVNWNYKKMIEKYNIVVISKIAVPLLASENELNKQFCYITDKHNPYSYPQKYIDNDRIEKYVERTNIVIQQLQTQKWVDKSHLAIIGHSQGAYIALEAAKENHEIIHVLGWFSGDVDGRYSSFIRQARNAAKSGFLTEEQAQKNIESIYNEWSDICRNEISKNESSKDSKLDILRIQKGFSQSFRETFTQLPTPVYVAYGTQDPAAESCDYLPIYFELAGKTNYKMDVYPGVGHNFEEISDGKSNFDKMHWDEVMNRFINWMESLNN